MQKLGQYLSNLEEVGYVLFDVFDTIITRTVHPEYVKRLAAKRLCLYTGLSFSPEEVYQARSRLERRLCEENKSAGYDYEFNFEYLCRRLYNELSAMELGRMNRIGRDAFIATCGEVEISVELGVQRVDEDCIQAIRHLKERGIPVGCISDFYLPKGMVLDMFRRHEIENLFKHVFVSSDLLLTKSSGRLFDRALIDIGFPPEKVLVIGDNRHSDFAAARAKNIKSYLVDRSGLRSFYAKFNKDALDIKRTTKRLNAAYESAERVLESSLLKELAFPLFHYTQKLHSRLISAGVRDVFFLSKEGQFLKELFDLYQESLDPGSRAQVRSHYLIASRKSTFIASLGPLKYERFYNLFREYYEISVFDFLSSLGFDTQEIEAVSNSAKVEQHKRDPNFERSKEFGRVLICPVFNSIYEKKRLTQKSNFKSYLESFGVDIRSQCLHLVDVGWKGTMQDNIFKLYDYDIKVHGYYLGLVGHGSAWVNNEKEGILFSLVPEKSPYCRVYNENKPLYEVVLGASHGSASSYEKNEDGVNVLLDDKEQEQELFKKTIRPMQENIRERFLILCTLMKDVHFNHEDFNGFFASKLARLMFMPSNEEMKFFEGLFHYENFGIFKVSRFLKRSHVWPLERFRNFMRLVSNPYIIFEECYWPSLKLAQMGLAPLRYLYGGFRYCQVFLGKKGNSDRRLDGGIDA